MNERIDSVLIPTDGSELAEQGARRGIDLAATAGADLHVLSVVESREVEPSLSDGPSDDRTEQEQRLETPAEEAVDSVAELALPHVQSGVTTAVEWGVPFREINAYADANDIDVIVMGTHGRAGLGRLLGSVANKTLRSASVPVLMVPPDAPAIEPGEGTYANVLLPTDGSDAAETAIDWAIAFAAIYDGTVHTVYSVDTSRFGGIADAAGIHEALEQTGEDALDVVRERARAADVSVAGTIGRGPAGRVIADYVDTHDVDLVAMGTHGRSGISRYLIGSVTEAVVRKVDVPVCCVPLDEL